MVKRDDSGSGLRAGFVRGDDYGQPPRKPAAQKAEEPVTKQQQAAAEPQAHEPENVSGPTIEMQGVSGKKIIGVVKVVKAVRPEKPAEPVLPAADEGAAAAEPKGEPAGQPAAAQLHVQPLPAVAERPVISATEIAAAVTAPAAPALHPDAAAPARKVESAKSAETAAPAAPTAPAAPAPSAPPAAVVAAAAQDTAPAEPAAPKTETAAEQASPAATGVSGTVHAPSESTNAARAPGEQRPQSDRPPQSQGGYYQRPQSDRPPQSQGGYYQRPQSDRPPQGQGGYYQRPQGDRPPQGQGGYYQRPQGDRPPQGQGGYYQRPQGDRPPQGPGGYPPRPQGDRGPGGPGGYQPRPQGDRGPGGPGGYTPRPQGDRGPGGPGGPGGYSPRPQGDRGPGGPGGYSPRPQGDRGPGGPGGYSPRPQGDRPQGGRGPGQGPRGRLQIPGVPDELKEKLPEAPRTNFAARDAFEKETKRDDRRDTKTNTTRSTPDVKDKHKTLQKQAQAISGQEVTTALSDEVLIDTLYKEPAKGARPRPTRGGRRPIQQPTPAVRAVLTHVTLPESLTVKEFAEAIKKTAAEVIKKLMKFGFMATLNQEIDFDTATIIAGEFNITTEKLVQVTEEEILFDDSEDNEGDLKPRPPVVVVMGHVDHGKTSILDRIRSSSVATGEAGGITQHIGAYTVRVKNRQITFLDTPGHEAFTTMRARGAQVTDIAILVVAADDGVMPQTIEAINHARAAHTQIVVAINKIDKEGANIDKVKQELATRELIPEEWGGTTVMVPVSAKTGAGIEELLEMVLLTADILDLKANYDKQAKGTVIEAKLDKNRGPVATVLVQRGTLRTGDSLVTGSIIGHVRAMIDDKGSQVKKAGPSIPVEVIGLPEVPEAGELFYAVTDDKVARTLAERRRVQQREQQLRSSSRMSLETLFSQIAAGEVKDLNLIVKADVQGSVEAVRQSLEKLSGKEVRVNIIHGAVGAITETDIHLAEVSNAIVIGFNVRPATNVADMAKDAGVDIRMYRVIYNAIEDIEAAMKGMLAPKFKEMVMGHAQVRQVFKVSGVGSIGGCYVTDGKIPRSCEVRVVRDGIVIHEGKMASLRRFKDDVREVAAGFECGIGLEKFNDIKENDVIEAYEMQEIERS
jgi:translation initiation factor IF-2